MIRRWQLIPRGSSNIYHSCRDAQVDKCNNRNNNFHFSAETNFQKICPFAAHIRKTNPRADLEGLTPPISIQSRRIMRRGIQFGPEVTEQERREGKTLHERGLLFACYQASITNGFAFIQESTSPRLPLGCRTDHKRLGWANNPKFPIGEKTPEVPGFVVVLLCVIRDIADKLLTDWIRLSAKVIGS